MTPTPAALMSDRFCQEYLPQTAINPRNVSGFKPWKPLMSLLGCVHINEFGQLREFKFVPHETRLAAIECIPRVLTHLVKIDPSIKEIGSLLGGLGRYNCWQPLLETVEGSRTLAEAAVVYTEQYAKNSPLAVAVEQDVCRILNNWLAPVTPWTKPPSSLDLSRCLFGDIWSDLMLPAEYEIEQGAAVGHVVARERPPFMPGVCPVQCVDVRLNLPTMAGENRRAAQECRSRKITNDKYCAI